MGMIKRAFRKIDNWMRNPRKTFGTGWAPTHRHIDDIVPPVIRRSHRPMDNKTRAFMIRVAKRRAANKVAYKSRRAQRIAS